MAETGSADVRGREPVWPRLAAARQAFEHEVSVAYDEVLVEVSARISDSGSIGKSDIGALVLWKRIQANTTWAARLMSMPDVEVRAVTRHAVDAVRDVHVPVSEAAGRGRGLLATLPGFTTGDALASALLVAAAPDRMAVYDRRAHAGLTMLGETLTSSPGRYRRYMDLIEKLLHTAQQHDQTWVARDVDLALFRLGKPH